MNTNLTTADLFLRDALLDEISDLKVIGYELICRSERLSKDTLAAVEILKNLIQAKKTKLEALEAK